MTIFLTFLAFAGLMFSSGALWFGAGEYRAMMRTYSRNLQTSLAVRAGYFKHLRRNIFILTISVAWLYATLVGGFSLD